MKDTIKNCCKLYHTYFVFSFCHYVTAEALPSTSV